MQNRTSIEAHYSHGSTDIAERIRTALPPGAPVTPDTLAPIDHFHGRGLAATKEMVEMLDPQPGQRILDFGCGVGGPARWIAAHYGCHVTGIDLTVEFCDAAVELNGMTGLSDQVEIVHGSAVQTPFEDASFDGAYSQNVIMNIAGKPDFYREAFRVLKPGAPLVLTCIADGPNGAPYYPSMWASAESDSFLETAGDIRAELEEAGFTVEQLEEMPERPGPRIEAEIAKAESGELPELGVHLLVGDGYRERLLNSLRSRRDLRVTRIDLLARKPA